jgi:transcriptional regulator with XRE-family HTH domain
MILLKINFEQTIPLDDTLSIGYNGTMQARMPRNPIKDLRESLGLTQKELAAQAGVTPNRVLREEQFVYERPSEKILFALWTAMEESDDAHHIEGDYLKAREQLHREFTDDLITSPFYDQHVKYALDYAIDYWDALSELRSPVRMFRESLFENYGLPPSAIKFSIYTGMHPGTLSDIETGKTDWNGAAALKHVLRSNLGCNNRIIDTLGVVHDQFFMRKV